MFSRRYLRIKVMHALYAYKQESCEDLEQTQQYLDQSLHSTYNLYVYLNKVVKDVLEYSTTDMELSNNKYIKSEEDILSTNAWMSFDYIKGLESFDFTKYFRKQKIKIEEDDQLYKRLYQAFKKDPEYQSIVKDGFQDKKQQVYALQYLLADVIMNHEEFDQFMEEYWLNWQDEKEYALNAVLKTIKACKTAEKSPIFSQNYRGREEDVDFVTNVLRSAIFDKENVLDMIAQRAKNWDIERITLLDNVILLLAITEMKTTDVPLRVSLDEYIEISKIYSTPKSKDFINGVLDKVMKDLQKENAK